MAEAPEIHADTVAQVILLSREIGESGQISEGMDDASDGSASSLAERELRDFIRNLNEDEQLSLVAIMWIGRDSFSADEYEEALETARDEHTNATESYLANMPLLADYLESGLEALGISPSEAEDGVI